MVILYLHIDNEFADLIPPLLDDEFERLTQSILAEGCRDPIVIWDNIIVDGHNRFRICTQHNIPYTTINHDFTDRDEVKLWMMNNQLARRNLNEAQRINIVRKCAPAVKAKAKERQATSTGGSEPQLVVKLPEAAQIRSRDELGKLAGVSGSTYERGEKVFEKSPKPIADAMNEGKLTINKAYETTKATLEQQTEIAERIQNIESEPEETNTPAKIVNDVLKPHVANNSGCNEWYTPAEYINIVRKTLKTIDLDPASCEFANKTVKATQYYSLENDGLKHEWHGRVFMNPPYGTEFIGKFIDKFIIEFRNKHIIEGIVLVNNATETAWFGRLAEEASAIAFPAKRIRFVSATRESYTPLQGQAFLYFGDWKENFFREFKDIGVLCKVIHNE